MKEKIALLCMACVLTLGLTACGATAGNGSYRDGGYDTTDGYGGVYDSTTGGYGGYRGDYTGGTGAAANTNGSRDVNRYSDGGILNADAANYGGRGAASANSTLRGSGASATGTVATPNKTSAGKAMGNYEKMLANGHVHDSDGDLHDNENTSYSTLY